MRLTRDFQPPFNKAHHANTFLQNYQVITWNQDGDADQTELDAVEDPLDGEAGQEDHTGEEDEADVEAA